MRNRFNTKPFVSRAPIQHRYQLVIKQYIRAHTHMYESSNFRHKIYAKPLNSINHYILLAVVMWTHTCIFNQPLVKFVAGTTKIRYCISTQYMVHVICQPTNQSDQGVSQWRFSDIYSFLRKKTDILHFILLYALLLAFMSMFARTMRIIIFCTYAFGFIVHNVINCFY